MAPIKRTPRSSSAGSSLQNLRRALFGLAVLLLFHQWHSMRGLFHTASSFDHFVEDFKDVNPKNNSLQDFKDVNPKNDSTLPEYFCDDCLLDPVKFKEVTCGERVDYLKKKYGGTYEQVQAAVQKAPPHNCVTSTKPKRVNIPTPFSYQACTVAQRQVILEQLPNVPNCYKSHPWLHRCSITKATKCPDSSSWLEDYYSNTHNHSDSYYFVAINVGCNKGYDALHYLRMGTRQAQLNKTAWKDALGSNVQEGVCQQELLEDLDLPPPLQEKVLPGQVHCIEPMPSTFQALRNAANITGYQQYGLEVVQTAMSDRKGTALLPSVLVAGTENKGLSSEFEQGQLEPVEQLTLDDYVVQYKIRQRIHVLLIDVEGYDFNVLLGANKTLEGVEYLEFEYNWSGPWEKQRLDEAILYLHDKSFTCYWAGVGKLWRLDSSCWLDHYNAHFWSNVACVHRQLVPDLARRMEEIFQATIATAPNNTGSTGT